VVKRIQRTEILHTDNFSTDVLGKLEVKSHFTAFGEWAVFTQEDHIVYLFGLIKRYLELHFLSSQNWPLSNHKFTDLLGLSSIDDREVAQLLVVFGRQVKTEVVEVEYLFW